MFKIGQKVVCVKATPSGSLKEDEIYTITWVGKGDMGCDAVEVAETRPTGGMENFYSWRFRAIDDDWVDELLESIKADKTVPA